MSDEIATSTIMSTGTFTHTVSWTVIVVEQSPKPAIGWFMGESAAAGTLSMAVPRFSPVELFRILITHKRGLVGTCATSNVMSQQKVVDPAGIETEAASIPTPVFGPPF